MRTILARRRRAAGIGYPPAMIRTALPRALAPSPGGMAGPAARREGGRRPGSPSRAPWRRGVAILIVATGLAAGAAPAQASDRTREQRWADQVLPTLVVGEAVTLATVSGTRFLALHTPVAKSRGTVVLTHGPGLHPDHGLTGELRVHLADRGYATLSLQMPVLAAEVDSGEAYRALFPDAVERIAAGVAFARRDDPRPVAIVSHAMGAGMAYAYLKATPSPPVAAWVALSFYGGFDDLSSLRFPIYDLYGAGDYWGIRGAAFGRAWKLRAVPGSKQLALDDGGRFLAGGEKSVLREVAAFLDATMPGAGK